MQYVAFLCGFTQLIAVNTHTVSACWVLCHHRAVMPSHQATACNLRGPLQNRTLDPIHSETITYSKATNVDRYTIEIMTLVIHCGKADVRTIGYLQPNMAGTSNNQIL